SARAAAVETAPLVEEFIAFKKELHALLEQCRVHAVFEPAILDHLRREAVWYLGMLARALGQPTPFRRELGLPNGNVRAALVPRRLIGRLPVSLNVVSLEYDLFWLHLHQEHAALLKTHTRPESQRRLYRLLASWEDDLGGLLRQGEQIFERLAARDRLRQPSPNQEVARFNRRLSALMTRWRNYLLDLTESLRFCRVPTGQANFAPAMTNHLRLEADYLLEALHRIATAADGMAGEDLV
ncbi:MAG TPA: DUF2935 domain-containing protein, partial [Firmicutes bacterium]|nr:DUF2935 domain-containing protein [Bacillota bacterium]